MKTIELGNIQISLYPKLDKYSGFTNPLEIMLPPNTSYELIIDYPLTRPFQTTFKTDKNGMSRKSFADLVCKCYKQIYQEEDAVCGKTPNIPVMLNRQTSGGPYGIWGHNIEDLTLCSANVIKNRIELEVGS